METQFPPSSPLIGNEVLGNEGVEEQYVKSHFKAPIMLNDELPTPNPSSSIGDANNQSVIFEEEVEKKPKIDKANPLNPQNFKRVLQVPLSGEEVRIGRSSNVCNFQLTSKNKSISRLHLKIKYLQDENACELRCIGYNGVNVTIPVMSNVHNLGDHKFSISVLKEEMEEKIDKSRLLEMNKDFTNFYMLRYETIKMPLINGTVLDIKGELILLQYPADKALNIEAIKSNQERIALGSNADDEDDANRTVESLSSDFDVIIDPRPIEKKDMVNSFIYKEATPECSFTQSTPFDTPIADKSFMIIENEKKHGEIDEDGAAEHVGLSKTNVSERTPLAVISNEQLNIISSIDTKGLLNKAANSSPKTIDTISLSEIDTPSAKNTDTRSFKDGTSLEAVSAPAKNVGIVEASSPIIELQTENESCEVVAPKNARITDLKDDGSIQHDLSSEKNVFERDAVTSREDTSVLQNDTPTLEKNAGGLQKSTKTTPEQSTTSVKVDTPENGVISPQILEGPARSSNAAEHTANSALKTVSPMEESVARSPKPVNATLEKAVAKPKSTPAPEKHATGSKSAVSSPKTTSASLEKPSAKGLKRSRKESNDEHLLTSMTASEIETTLAEIEDLNDLCNIIINHIAYSRILQTPLKSIMDLSTMRSLSKHQLRCMLIHHIPCIGVIFRKGKDAAGKPLDEEYYYIPERDNDQARVKLVEDVKGSSSHLRSCRKTHKQYFWKKPRI